MNLFEKFWKLQTILCDRDYLSTSRQKWNEVRDLLTSVLGSVTSIKCNGRGQDKEPVDGLLGQKMYLEMKSLDERGKSYRIHHSSSSSFSSSISSSIDSQVILPLYYTNASHFLLQLTSPSTRRSFLLQIYFYLHHLLTFSILTSHEDTKKEINHLFSEVTNQLARIPHGSAFLKQIQHHHDREAIWLEWKENKMPPMIDPDRPSPSEHAPVVCHYNERSEGEVHLLCREPLKGMMEMEEEEERNEKVIFYDREEYEHETDRLVPGDNPLLEDYEDDLQRVLEPVDPETEAARRALMLDDEEDVWKPYQDEVGDGQ